MKPGLYIVATPIGNLKDITFRAVEVLKACDIILCEDTRKTKTLLNEYGIKTKTEAFHEHNENEKIEKIKKYIEDKNAIALVSDAGSPLISDPGYTLIRELNKENVHYTTIPGPSSVISALILSGLPTDKFAFFGFLSKKKKDKEKEFIQNENFKGTSIYFETAQRLIDTLKLVNGIYADRKVSVVREITKLFEEVKTNTPKHLIEYYTENPPKGEIVLLVKGTQGKELKDEEIEDLLKKEMKQETLSKAVKKVSDNTNVPKSKVYGLALKIKK
jgi:16S rRNA (cytidine1402-2'-O)-methyltransferase